MTEIDRRTWSSFKWPLYFLEYIVEKSSFTSKKLLSVFAFTFLCHVRIYKLSVSQIVSLQSALYVRTWVGNIKVKQDRRCFVLVLLSQCNSSWNVSNTATVWEVSGSLSSLVPLCEIDRLLLLFKLWYCTIEF